MPGSRWSSSANCSKNNPPAREEPARFPPYQGGGKNRPYRPLASSFASSSCCMSRMRFSAANARACSVTSPAAM